MGATPGWTGAFKPVVVVGVTVIAVLVEGWVHPVKWVASAMRRIAPAYHTGEMREVFIAMR